MYNISDKVLNRIKRHGKGWTFKPKDFHDLSTRANIDKILSRLTSKNFIRRLGRGIYDYPKISTVFGLPLSPNIDSLAKTIDSSVFMSGAAAANALGLSNQVPARPSYLTNRNSRVFKVSSRNIILRHARIPIDKNMGDKLNMLLQALYYIGKNNIDDDIISKCAKIITMRDIDKILCTNNKIPFWLLDLIHKIHAYKQRPTISNTTGKRRDILRSSQTKGVHTNHN